MIYNLMNVYRLKLYRLELRKRKRKVLLFPLFNLNLPPLLILILFESRVLTDLYLRYVGMNLNWTIVRLVGVLLELS